MSEALHPLTFPLLRRLADGNFHSGEVLAREFCVTRATVHNALKHVAETGLVLYRVRGRGYRLANPVQWLDAQAIQRELGEAAASLRIEIIDQAPSSNTLLLQRCNEGAATGLVLAVEWQTAGRGRHGRVWHVGLGKALTYSVLWRFESGLAGLSGLSLAVGVAIVRALHELGFRKAGLKWPNDVWLGEGKLGGILIEAQGDIHGPSAAVIGIGLNLCEDEALRARLDQPVSALAAADAPPPDRNRVLAASLKHLVRVLQDFARDGLAPLRTEWEQHHVHQGSNVRVLLPDGSKREGRAVGITDEGALRLQTTQGFCEFHAGEVSLREA